MEIASFTSGLTHKWSVVLTIAKVSDLENRMVPPGPKDAPGKNGEGMRCSCRGNNDKVVATGGGPVKSLGLKQLEIAGRKRYHPRCRQSAGEMTQS